MTLTPSRTSERLRSRPIPASSTSSRSSRTSTTSSRARSPPKIPRTTNPQRAHTTNIASDEESYESVTHQSTRTHQNDSTGNATSNPTNIPNNDISIADENSTSQVEDDSSSSARDRTYNPDIRDLQNTVNELRNQLHIYSER